MGVERAVDSTLGVGESIPNSSDGNHTSNGEDSEAVNPVISTAQTRLVGAETEASKDHAEGMLLSVALGGVQHVAPSSDSHGPNVNETAISQKSPGSTLEETIHAIESSTGNPMALVRDVTDVNVNDVAGDIKDKALARLRAVVCVYAAKLPIVGSYFVNKIGVGASNVDAGPTETTPLLGALQDPKAFATKQAEGLFRRLFSPLLSRIPDVDALDNVESDNYGPLFKIFVECYALTRDGGGWLFTHLQEHSLVIAPTVSLGHLSTTDLAASTIGTTVTSVTGYSIIQGFISSLDKTLADAPNRRMKSIACAQAAVVTGVVLFPITNLWSVHSGTLLQRLGQPPEVAGPASQFLQVAAAGLPGYAISEIAKRYLTSQGLSSVHTRILSATAPLNLLLNYLLVDGPIPALRLGFAGAPLCTVLSHNALAIMLVIYIVQRAIREEVVHLREQNIVPDEPLRANNNTSESSQNHSPSDVTFFTGIGALILAGTSGVLKSASELWSKDFGGVVASVLGPEALATQAVLLTTATTLYQAPKALGNASSDRIKKWMAKGNVQRAKIAAAVAFFSTLGGVLIISNIILAFASSWGKLFNSDPVIIQNVAVLLPVIAIFQAVHGIGAWVDSSLGALGRTAVFPSLNASGDYFLGIPLGVYLALWGGWGLAGLWIGLSVSLAYSCFVATIVLVRCNWKRGKTTERDVEPADEPSSVGVLV